MSNQGSNESLFFYQFPNDQKLSKNQASSVLESALRAEPETPVDELMTELTREKGQQWLEEQLQPGHLAPQMPAGDVLRTEGVPIETLNELRSESKRLRGSARSAPDRARAVLLYFLCQATALVHHQKVNSSMDSSLLADVLSDLAAVTDSPWGDYFHQAVEELRKIG